ncbi:MAG TPA: hypothetical protein GX523_04915 [Desulfitobacterium dehalogenans]|uniref:Uncharacterized protein n=1 Tax=Desulfitobacterium dehalogenans TaxID=36854 RepID=A0A7C6Z399_9FIRM|nr:hypothetical protein [Desulfitobacterium dehalogenans]
MPQAASAEAGRTARVKDRDRRLILQWHRSSRKILETPLFDYFRSKTKGVQTEAWL